MKKTLLTVLVSSGVLLTCNANAAFSEGDGTFSSSLEFKGSVTDTTPIWAFELPNANVTGWEAYLSGSTTSGNQTKFKFDSKPSMVLIQGYMKAPSPSGGTGLLPSVTVGSGDATTELNGSSKSLTFEVTGLNSAGEAVTPGTMTMNGLVELGGATETSYFGATNAQQLLSANQDEFAINYPDISNSTSSYSSAESTISSTDQKKVSAAYVVTISNYELSFDSASLPATWTVQIPVTVGLK